MNIGIMVQARMGSTRLPGKVLKTVLERPLLEYQIERLRYVKGASQLIVATTVLPEDDLIINLCKKISTSYYRGSAHHVLARYYEAASEFKLDHVIRITGDCPLIDPVVIDHVLSYYLSHIQDYDYVSNVIQRSYPRGMDCEIFSMKMLETAYREAQDTDEQEHVTLFIYRRPERFRLGHVIHKKNMSSYRLTVDTVEDFELIYQLIERLYPYNKNFTMEDCIECLEKNPRLLSINAHIEQRLYS